MASGPHSTPDDLGAAVEVLRQVPYFRDLETADLAAVVCSSLVCTYQVNEILFLEGEECRGLYIVRSGLVRIFKTAPDSREQVLRLIGPGESFNVVPVFDGKPNPASAQALEPTTILLLPKRDVQQLVRSNPAFAATVTAIFASRLRHLVMLVEDLSFRHVTARVAKIILQATHPVEGVGAGAHRQRRLTQQQMAEMAGTAREVVGRALKVLEEAGAIRVERGHIDVLNAEILETWT